MNEFLEWCDRVNAKNDPMGALEAFPKLLRITKAATVWSKNNDDANYDCFCFRGLDEAMQSALENGRKPDENTR